MKDEIKEILIKDFNEILVKEFCTDWKEKRLYIELLLNATPFTNLLNYITNLQEENKELKKKITFNEKSRRKMQQSLMEQIEQLKEENERLNNIINELEKELSITMF